MNVFEKIREKLQDYQIWKELLIYDISLRERQIIEKSIEIVNQIEQEHNNGWILFDVEKPPRPKENPVFDGKQLELYLVCTSYSDYPFRAFWNGKYFADGMSKIEDVIAWQPLPEPFVEKITI